MMTIKPGKQRRYLYNAPLHKKRKWIASHLEEGLLLKYDRRSVPVIVGDTVRIMRGSFKGHENKVTRVDVKSGYVEVEGVTMTKADGKKIPKPVHPSNLLITKLNLTDRWRRERLAGKLSEEKKREIEKEAAEQVRLMEEKKEEERRRLEEEKAKQIEEAKDKDRVVEPEMKPEEHAAEEESTQEKTEDVKKEEEKESQEPEESKEHDEKKKDLEAKKTRKKPKKTREGE